MPTSKDCKAREDDAEVAHRASNTVGYVPNKGQELTRTILKIQYIDLILLRKNLGVV